MSLRPDETDLIGNWIKDGNRVVGDAVETRIDQLIAHDLRRVAASPESGGWDVLYRDLSDGRYWELTYRHGEMQGGGPKRLTLLSQTEATEKYRLIGGNAEISN